jgi:Tol biopolymer transport system component
VTCKVTDEYRREAIDEVTATLTFDLSNAKQKLLYVAANFEGAAATLISIYEDGVGREQIMPTPPGKAYHIGAWTPDGTKLMLYGDTGGNGDDMYLANSNGSDYHPIEQSNEGQGSAEWSPLGTKICFICPTDNTLRNRREVAVMNADGSDFRQLTSTSGAEESLFTHHEGGYLPGGWSYDEKHIVYGIGNEIWVVDVEAPNATRKVSGSLACSLAGWSPAGNDLYLVSNGDLYRYTPSPPNWPATEPKRVTAGAGVKSFQISPDGGKALFNRTLGGIAMCLLPADGEDPITDFQQLSNGSDVCPSWLDNETVSFVRRSGGQPDVYTCSLADLKLTNVTQANHGLFFQGWTPDLSGAP